MSSSFSVQLLQLPNKTYDVPSLFQPPEGVEDEKLGIEDGGEEDTKIPMDQYDQYEYDQYDEGRKRTAAAVTSSPFKQLIFNCSRYVSSYLWKTANG